MPLLSLITFLPLFGVAFILLVRGDREAVARNSFWMAVWVSLVNLVLALSAWFSYDRSVGGFQFVEEVEWVPALRIAYRMGVDGVSLPFVVLSALLTLAAVLASARVRERTREYMILFLVLETLMIGSFCALDLFLFYVFFEGVLIPMFLIIGMWGGARRIYSAFKFFLYTLAGSVLMLLAVLYIWTATGSSDVVALAESRPFPPGAQKWLWLAFLASFAVKMPMWPVHTWLPDAHVEAPTAGSMILAGVLLKLGGYGLLRFSLPLFPDASAYFAPLIFALSVVAVVYASLAALAQQDMKKMVAYSSVAHMGFVTAGIFTFTRQGIEGAVFQMVSHGIVSAALFLAVGVLYDRTRSRSLADYGGLARTMPRYAVLLLVFVLGSVALPGTSGFVGEFLVILGAMRASGALAFGIALGMVLGATYMLLLYRRVAFGTPREGKVASLPDLAPHEMLTLAPLAVLVVWLGIQPGIVLAATAATTENLAEMMTPFAPMESEAEVPPAAPGGVEGADGADDGHGGDGHEGTEP